MYFYLLTVRRSFPSLNFYILADFLALPAALTATLIRLGNFINQEILGTPTQMPWGVIFGSPADGSMSIPRHPVQLYEGFVYFSIFLFLYWLWKKEGDLLRPGTLVGWLFILVFGSRIILEFWKSDQASILPGTYFQMGQWLSIPFIVAGIFLLLRSRPVMQKFKKT